MIDRIDINGSRGVDAVGVGLDFSHADLFFDNADEAPRDADDTYCNGKRAVPREGACHVAVDGVEDDFDDILLRDESVALIGVDGLFGLLLQLEAQLQEALHFQRHGGDSIDFHEEIDASRVVWDRVDSLGAVLAR